MLDKGLELAVNPLGDVSCGGVDSIADRSSRRWALWFVDFRNKVDVAWSRVFHY